MIDKQTNTNMPRIITKEYLTDLITDGTPRSVKAIGKALVHIMNRQREDEKQNTTTNYNNGIGFTPADARSGTLTAFYFLKHGTLLDWQIEKWVSPNAKGTPRLAKYWKQLDEVAQLKAA